MSASIQRIGVPVENTGYGVANGWKAQLAKSVALTASSLGVGWVLSKLWNGANPVEQQNGKSALTAEHSFTVIPGISQKIGNSALQPDLSQRVDISYPQTSRLACGMGLIMGAAGSAAMHSPLPLALGSTLCVPRVFASGYLFSPPDGIFFPPDLRTNSIKNPMRSLAETQHSRLIATTSGLWSISRHEPLIQWNISSSTANVVSSANVVVNQQQLFVLVDNTQRLVTCYSETGTILWNVSIAGDVVADLVIDSSAVYVAYSAPNVQPVVTKMSALAIDTGFALWTTDFNGHGGSLMTIVQVTPMLVLNFYLGDTYALSTTNGTIAWSSWVDGGIQPGPSSTTIVTMSGSGGTFMSILDAVSGATLSSGTVESGYIDFSANGSSLFIGGSDGVSYLLVNESTIDLQWTYTLQSSYVSSMVVRSGFFYIFAVRGSDSLSSLRAVTTSYPPLLSWELWNVPGATWGIPGLYGAIAEGQNGLIVYQYPDTFCSSWERQLQPIICVDYGNGSIIWTSPLECQCSHLFSIENGVIKLSCDSGRVALAMINETTGAIIDYATKTISSSKTKSSTPTRTLTVTAPLVHLPPSTQATDNVRLIAGATMGGVVILASSVAIAACVIRMHWLKKPNDDAVTETSRLNSEAGSQILPG